MDRGGLPGTQPGFRAISGRGGDQKEIVALRQAFPDIRFNLAELLGENATVAARYHWEGTRQGAFLGIKPTGKRIRGQGMVFYGLQNARIVDHWDCVDEIGLLRQLGVWH